MIKVMVLNSGNYSSEKITGKGTKQITVSMIINLRTLAAVKQPSKNVSVVIKGLDDVTSFYRHVEEEGMRCDGLSGFLVYGNARPRLFEGDLTFENGLTRVTTDPQEKKELRMEVLNWMTQSFLEYISPGDDHSAQMFWEALRNTSTCVSHIAYRAGDNGWLLKEPREQ